MVSRRQVATLRYGMAPSLRYGATSRRDELARPVGKRPKPDGGWRGWRNTELESSVNPQTRMFALRGGDAGLAMDGVQILVIANRWTMGP
jgi:hypothetical protein